MNKTAALILTIIIDFCLLLAGSGLIVLLNVGGIFIMLIEFYCIKSIHKAIFKWLTGIGHNAEEKETESITTEVQITENNKQEEDNCAQEAAVNNSSNDKVENNADTEINVPLKVDTLTQIAEQVNTHDVEVKEDNVSFSEEEATKLPYELDIEDLIHDKEEIATSVNVLQKDNDRQKESGFNYIKIFFAILSVAAIVIAFSFCIRNCNTENSTRNNLSQSDSTEIDLDGEVTKPASYENEVERWDAESCVYANFKNGVAFRLPNDIPWHKISGTAKHTVVKFVQPNTEITLFVNIHELPKCPQEASEDIWRLYDVFTERIIPEAMRMASENSNETIIDYTFRKSEICGKHAIKTVYKSQIADSRIDGKINIITIEYTFLYRQCNYTVTLKSYEDVKISLAEDGIDLEDFLQSFSLTPIDDTL